MSRARWLLGAAILTFLITLLLRLPLRWVSGHLPSGVQCTDAHGTLWHGGCGRLAVAQLDLGAARWQLHGLRLLAGRLSAEVETQRSALAIRGTLGRTIGGRITGEQLQLQYALGSGLIPQLPSLDGAVSARFDELVIDGMRVDKVRGWLEARDLVQVGTERLALGSYRIEFDRPPAADGSITGKVRDLGGPLDMQATLTLTGAPGYLLQGTVLARPEASATLVRQISFLGSPDADGRRSFSQEASF